MNNEIKLFDTAILLIVFNRLDTTKYVFDAIKKIKPSRFYIASDGARELANEKDKVDEIRNFIINSIDWDCDVKTLFREKNMSCGPSVKSAIDWFFSYEERGIILEDDTLPNKSFFNYAEELLIRYENDYRIGMISGNNHIGESLNDESYLFSKFKYTWGWATWKRAWSNMNLDMTWVRTNMKNSIISNMGYSNKSIVHWNHNINLVNTNKVNTWDYQWFLTLSSQNQLSIVPRNNLVSNIGFGNDATHTFGEANPEFLFQKELEFPLKHPRYIVPYIEYEKEYEKEQIVNIPLWKKIIPRKIKNIIKILLLKKR